jgi:hypothetical protein
MIWPRTRQKAAEPRRERLSGMFGRNEHETHSKSSDKRSKEKKKEKKKQQSLCWRRGEEKKEQKKQSGQGEVSLN